MSLRLRLYGYDEYICLVVHEAAYQTLVLIGFGALHTHALSLAYNKVRLHVRGFCKHQFLGRDAIFVGNLHQVGDGYIYFACLDLLVLVE